MIRRDFETGGFPINKHNPVLCFTKAGKLFIAYNNYDLKMIFDNTKIKKALGIWPGKFDTDCFPFDINKYSLFAPPEEHKNIDDAYEIHVYFNNKKLDHIDYFIIDKNKDAMKIRSTDKKLLDYIEKAGKKVIRHIVSFPIENH